MKYLQFQNYEFLSFIPRIKPKIAEDIATRWSSLEKISSFFLILMSGFPYIDQTIVSRFSFYTSLLFKPISILFILCRDSLCLNSLIPVNFDTPFVMASNYKKYTIFIYKKWNYIFLNSLQILEITTFNHRYFPTSSPEYLSSNF